MIYHTSLRNRMNMIDFKVNDCMDWIYTPYSIKLFYSSINRRDNSFYLLWHIGPSNDFSNVKETINKNK